MKISSGDLADVIIKLTSVYRMMTHSYRQG